MADESQYPKRWSDIEITFLDGEVVTHRCSFGSHFAPHLAKQSGETGILTLLCGPKTYSYPLTSIRGWTISQLPDQPEDQSDDVSDRPPMPRKY